MTYTDSDTAPGAVGSSAGSTIRYVLLTSDGLMPRVSGAPRRISTTAATPSGLAPGSFVKSSGVATVIGGSRAGLGPANAPGISLPRISGADGDVLWWACDCSDR